MPLPPAASFDQIDVGAFTPVGGEETATSITGTVQSVVCPDPYSFNSMLRLDVLFTDGTTNTVYRLLCERVAGARPGILPDGLMVAPTYATSQREDAGGDKQLPAVGSTVVLETLTSDVGSGGAVITQRTLRVKVQGSATGKREWIMRYQGKLSSTPAEES